MKRFRGVNERASFLSPAFFFFKKKLRTKTKTVKTYPSVINLIVREKINAILVKRLPVP
jgi:hypothetical protein